MDGIFVTNCGALLVVGAPRPEGPHTVRHAVYGSYGRTKWNGELSCLPASTEARSTFHVTYACQNLHVDGVGDFHNVTFHNAKGEAGERWTRCYMTTEQFTALSSPLFTCFSPAPYLLYTTQNGSFVLVRASAGRKHAVHGAQRIPTADANWYGDILELSRDKTGTRGLVQVSSKTRGSYAFGVYDASSRIVFRGSDDKAEEVWTWACMSVEQAQALRWKPRVLLTFVILRLAIVAARAVAASAAKVVARVRCALATHPDGAASGR